MSALKIKFMVWVIAVLIYLIENIPAIPTSWATKQYLVKQGQDITDELVNFDGGDI